MQPVIRETDVGIVLPDGTRLSAQVWRPAGGGRYPAILEYIPYRWRDGTAARDAAMHPWFAAQGYVSLRVDIRGHGQSRGVPGDEYSRAELQDACDEYEKVQRLKDEAADYICGKYSWDRVVEETEGLYGSKR